MVQLEADQENEIVPWSSAFMAFQLKKIGFALILLAHQQLSFIHRNQTSIFKCNKELNFQENVILSQK